MVALIVERTSGGKTRTCNSRCYGAKGAECICCCGGKNHGMGLNKAIDNTREATQELLAKADTAISLPFKEGERQW